MGAHRRVRVALVPVDGPALATIAGLVASDPDGRAEFGGFYGRAPVALAPLLDSDRRAWLLSSSAQPVGFIDADRVGDVVHLAYFVRAQARCQGIASSAVGRVLGMRLWPEVERFRITTGSGNIASQAVARRNGFSLAHGADGEEVWERAAPPPVRVGIERHLSAEGRIDHYPASAGERRALLAWVAERALGSDEVLDEAAVTVRLSAFADDVALLRRQLVDHGFLERTVSGSQYARVREPDPTRPARGVSA